MSSPCQLETLVKLSSRIGHDLNLVQAGGGNTSLKDGEMLWIKASGKWLVNAEHDDMFVPVPLADTEHSLATEDERFPEYPARSGALLRPSVETTMHAVLPHRVVIHVHSVAAISWAAQAGGEQLVADRLAGLRWAWIPYIHPGVPLALRIREELGKKPDVLLLANHGLVVAADDCETAEALLIDVGRRLSTNPRSAPEPDFEALDELAAGSGWSPAHDHEVHALGTNTRSAAIAAGGTMYPDHCVYLGPAAADLHPGESVAGAIARYAARHDYQPAFLLVHGQGVLTSTRLSRAGRELLICLKRVVERIPADSTISYLEDSQVDRLMNWDAEKYRIAMARLEQ
jgi:rhamnose utilization protein RhaD (predicted bifunctional aldolase and dehydrogenase)